MHHRVCCQLLIDHGAPCRRRCGVPTYDRGGGVMVRSAHRSGVAALPRTDGLHLRVRVRRRMGINATAADLVRPFLRGAPPGTPPGLERLGLLPRYLPWRPPWRRLPRWMFSSRRRRPAQQWGKNTAAHSAIATAAVRTPANAGGHLHGTRVSPMITAMLRCLPASASTANTARSSWRGGSPRRHVGPCPRRGGGSGSSSGCRGRDAERRSHRVASAAAQHCRDR